ncbi:MAG TPA: sulfatase-like hydrolase/transferase [Terriglobales bacterium]|nr:sulfatase-like hydrolase/transferase [Terriglobales bacterium]
MGVIRQWMVVMWLAASAFAATQPNIILITLDTTRADRMGFLGSTRGLTPNLDALARQSAVFTHAYSQAPLTSVSHASILTGTYPQFHQVLDFPMPLAKDLPYTPDILHAQGYQTAAFLASMALDPTGGAPGLDRGFDTCDAGFQHEGFKNQTRYQTVERRGGEVVTRALAWLNQHPKGPFFLWVHLYDAHDPYDPPEPYKTRYAKDLYDGEIAYADASVGKLFRELKARGLYEGSLIAVMADHGEALGAHGEDTHGIFLYDETIHVPLVIKLPQATTQKKIDNRVELVDVMPTLLQAVGVAVPPEVQGESLLQIIQAKPGEPTAAVEAWRDRPAYAQADYAHLAYGWSAEKALRTGKYLYIEAPRRELYDQLTDPTAEHNLAPTSKAVADTLAAKTEAFHQKTSNKRELPKTVVDAAAQEKLAALGYVGSGTYVSKSGSSEEPDPKDKIATANVIRQVNFLFENGRFEDAIPILEDLVKKETGMSMLYGKLGGSYMKTHQYEKAVPVLRKAVELDPALTMAQMDLGRALLRTEDFNGAATVFETLLARMPLLLDAHLFLEVAYARAGRVPDTIKECEKVIEIMPEHYGSYLTLGRALAKSGNDEGAIPKLEKAAALRPQAPDPHVTLAEIYVRLGRKTDAERERAEAQRLAMMPQQAQ